MAAPHRNTGKTRSGRRNLNALSFHSLRLYAGQPRLCSGGGCLAPWPRPQSVTTPRRSTSITSTSAATPCRERRRYFPRYERPRRVSLRAPQRAGPKSGKSSGFGPPVKLYQRAIPLTPKCNTQVAPESAIMPGAGTAVKTAQAKLKAAQAIPH